MGRNKLRIAVIDDETFYIQDVYSKIENFKQSFHDIDIEVDTFTQGKEFLDSFKEHPYDLIYLDIELNDINGVHLAHMIHEKKASTMIIFMTSHMSYIHQSYVVNAFQYLTKPLKDPLFTYELKRAIKHYQYMQKAFVFPTSQGRIIFNLSEIIYLETAYKNYKIHTTRGVYYGSLKAVNSIRKALLDYTFVKIQRSFIVNMEHIVKVDNILLYMSDESMLMVSKKRYKEFKRRFYQFLADKK